MAMEVTLTDPGIRECAVVTSPDEIGGALAQRFDHPPAVLGRELAYGREQQTLREKQWDDRDRLGQPVEHIGDAWGAGAETAAYWTATAISEPSRKIKNSLVRPRPGRPDTKQQD